MKNKNSKTIKIYTSKDLKSLSSTIQEALIKGCFTITENLHNVVINAIYKNRTLNGEITITATTTNLYTEIQIKTTANIDNIYAYFLDPNKRIMHKFRKHLNIKDIEVRRVEKKEMNACIRRISGR